MKVVLEHQPPVSQDRGALAKMVMTLLDHWKLPTEDQAALLGIATSNRAALTRYRKGEPIGTSRDQFERVGHLLGIHKNLRLLFPQNPGSLSFSLTAPPTATSLDPHPTTTGHRVIFNAIVALETAYPR